MGNCAPGYVGLSETGKLDARLKNLKERLKSCIVCPHHCKVDRPNNERGFCRAGVNMVIDGYGPHYGEESVLVGKGGSGTIFFSYCTLQCVFCQNCEISHHGEGYEITPSGLAKIMLSLQNKGCHNINFVSPSHFVPQIVEAVGLAFGDNTKAKKYTKSTKYFDVVKSAVKEMHRQVGDLKMNEEGIACKGLLIRHLVMPENIANTDKILDFISNEVSKNTLINIMSQYYPAHKSYSFPELSRKISRNEYNEAVKYAENLGLTYVMAT